MGMKIDNVYRKSLDTVVEWIHHEVNTSKTQKALKKEHFLWQLYNIETDIEKANEDVETEKRSREALVQEVTDYEREASVKKKEQAKYLKEIAQSEKKLAEKRSRLDKNFARLEDARAAESLN